VRDWQEDIEHSTYQEDPKSPLGLVRLALRRKTSTFKEQMCGVNIVPLFALDQYGDEITFNEERATLRPIGAKAEALISEAIRTIARNILSKYCGKRCNLEPTQTRSHSQHSQ
jgi:hypothetical protein